MVGDILLFQTDLSCQRQFTWDLAAESQLGNGQAKQKHVCLRCPLESTQLVLRYCTVFNATVTFITQPCKVRIQQVFIAFRWSEEPLYSPGLRIYNCT